MAWQCSEPVMSRHPSVAITNMKGPAEGMSVEVMSRAGTLQARLKPWMH